MNCVCLIALFTICCSISASVLPTTIYTQEQFDSATELINKGKEINLVLAPGEYYLKKQIRATAPLSITGKSATISSACLHLTASEAVRKTKTHNVYKINYDMSLFPLLYGGDGQLLAISESVSGGVGVNFVVGDIMASSGYGKGTQLKIPIPARLNHLKNRKFAKAFGYLDSGWDEIHFRLDNSDNNYFYCTTLNNCSTKNFQYDRATYKKDVRFVIYNAELKEDAIYFDAQWLYVPKDINEIYVVNLDDEQHSVPGIITYSDIVLDGVCFKGGTKVSVHSKKNGKCEIKRCSFYNTLGYALNLVKENGTGARLAVVDDCTFQDCSIYTASVVLLTSNKNNGATCVEMKRCTINRYRSDYVLYKNTKGAIWADGDIALTENVVYNTCRNHLHLSKGTIIAKRNVLLNTDSFNHYSMRNLSSDWGLIYCDHPYTAQEAIQNTGNQILIEGNLLYGAYAYGGDARGIFIDHGRGDVTCKDNIILNTQHYSMDARNTKKTTLSSVRNRYEGNIVTSRYRLAAGSSVSGNNVPITSGNIVLTSKKNVVKNIQNENKDTQMNLDASTSCDNNTIIVSQDVLRILKSSLAWNGIKKYIKTL